MSISPTVIPPDNAYALQPTSGYGMGDNAFGVRLGFTF